MVSGSGVTHRRRSSPYRNSRSPPQRRGDRPAHQGSCRQTRRAASSVHTQCRAVGPESCVCRPHLRRTVFVTTGGTLLYSLSGKPKQNAADVGDPCKKRLFTDPRMGSHRNLPWRRQEAHQRKSKGSGSCRKQRGNDARALSLNSFSGDG